MNSLEYMYEKLIFTKENNWRGSQITELVDNESQKPLLEKQTRTISKLSAFSKVFKNNCLAVNFSFYTLCLAFFRNIILLN
jgi:hypothetical protein